MLFYADKICHSNNRIPTAPKATGAVFAIRQSPAACKGRKPSPTKSAAVIATGPPKPIAPSKMNQNKNLLKSLEFYDLE